MIILIKFLVNFFEVNYTTKITLQDNSDIPVEIEGFKENFGICTILVAPTNN